MLMLAAVNPYLAVFLDNLAELAVFLLLPVLGTVVWKGFQYLETKLGIDFDQKTEGKLQDVLRSAVLRAGEWARAKAKAGAPFPAGAEKLAAAVDFVQGELDRLGYAKMAEDRIKALVEAALAKVKLEQAVLSARGSEQDPT